MKDLTKPLYDPCREWMKRARDNKKEWEEIKFGLGKNEEDLGNFLIDQKVQNFWPSALEIEDWYRLVKSEEETEKKSLEMSSKEVKAALVDESQDSEVTVPEGKGTSWQVYRAHLLNSGFKQEAVDEIEDASIALLKRLNSDTFNAKPVKGLVIGHVQSGKTANMAALMAMAADWGWNMFIVLSGTVENLRKQTQKRLLNDLNRPGNLEWKGLERLSKRSNENDRLQELRLEEDSASRYFTVCLKNSTRLKNLLEWMQTDSNKMRQLKIIVIDDEADQASINTADIMNDERTKINSLIVNMVEGNKPDGKKLESGYKAMNYVSYTATPYANFLNEASPESLYPSNFIRSLKPSNEYFGPKQIFGGEDVEDGDGLDIIRSVSYEDAKILKRIDSKLGVEMPESLEDAICWFLCCVATMRYWDYAKPVSMLIHTSQRQGHHAGMADRVSDWLKRNSSDYILKKCEILWEKESKRFAKEDLRKSYPNYGRDDSEINDYPHFDQIRDGIRYLILETTHIPLNEEGDLTYTEHIHLCIDNCSNNGIDEDGMHVRLAYPDPKMKNYPSPAPAFIVIGGSTLSRGLTIEGLVSTYFLRATAQADTLMQMGRWFGYRRGYELLQRIWMTGETLEKFRFLTVLESELRDDLHRFMVAGAKPSEYGPRIKNSPKVSWLRVTARNRMQNAMETDLDFSGTSTQLILYENDAQKLAANVNTTEAFLQQLGNSEPSHSGSARIWKDVKYSDIYNLLLREFNFHPRATMFNNLEAFTQWVRKLNEDGKLENWNVIVAGVSREGVKSSTDLWDFGTGSVIKVNRSRKKAQNGNGDVINLGVLRAPSDLIADIDMGKLNEAEKELIKSGTLKTRDVDSIRKSAGLDKTPQLIIYRVKRDSTTRNKDAGGLREDLKAPEDLIGLCINIPGNRESGSLARSLTINITDNIILDDLEEQQ